MERMKRAIEQVYNDLVIPTMRADKTSEQFVEQRVLEILHSIMESEGEVLLADYQDKLGQ